MTVGGSEIGDCGLVCGGHVGIILDDSGTQTPFLCNVPTRRLGTSSPLQCYPTALFLPYPVFLQACWEITRGLWSVVHGFGINLADYGKKTIVIIVSMRPKHLGVVTVVIPLPFNEHLQQ